LRVAHVTSTFPPYMAGTGNVCFYNALELARRGHSVTVFTAAYPPGEFEYPPEFRVERLPYLFRMGNAPFLPGLLALRDFDIIHLHYPFIFGSEKIWCASRLWGIPYVVTCHNDLLGLGWRQIALDIYTRLTAAPVLRSASRLIVVSADYGANSQFAHIFAQHAPDVVEVPNGVDTTRFRPGVDGTPIRVRYNIPPQAGVVMFVGTLDRAHPAKRLDILLEAMAGEQLAEAYLLVVGGGELLDNYQTQARQLGVARRVIFTGLVAHSDLPPYYAAADVLALPSDAESFGIVLIEAMACGTPVVAFHIPGVRQVVDDGQTGLLVEPGERAAFAAGLGRVLSDADLRARLGEAAARLTPRRYAWPAIAARLETLYQSVLEQRPATEVGAYQAR
jgi:glycosyltransferase involved in cell wall biosynthesis